MKKRGITIPFAPWRLCSHMRKLAILREISPGDREQVSQGVSPRIRQEKNRRIEFHIKFPAVFTDEDLCNWSILFRLIRVLRFYPWSKSPVCRSLFRRRLCRAVPLPHVPEIPLDLHYPCTGPTNPPYPGCVSRAFMRSKRARIY